MSILAWDIDRFKTINDAYGHKAGDKVLRVIGQHLARHVRDTDFVGRYGGEEFVMLLVGTDADEAAVVAEKIRLEISQLGFHFHDQPGRGHGLLRHHRLLGRRHARRRPSTGPTRRSTAPRKPAGTAASSADAEPPPGGPAASRPGGQLTNSFT